MICPNCGQQMSLCAIIFSDPSLIRILESLGQPTRLPSRAPPARTGTAVGAKGQEVPAPCVVPVDPGPCYEDACDPIYEIDLDQRVPEHDEDAVSRDN